MNEDEVSSALDQMQLLSSAARRPRLPDSARHYARASSSGKYSKGTRPSPALSDRADSRTGAELGLFRPGG